MKKIIYSMLIASVLLTAGCAKLDEDVYSSIASKNYYRNEADLKIALTAAYKIYQTAYGGGDVYNYFMIIEAASETGAPTRTKNNPHLYKAWAYANDADNTINKWSESYQIINQVNAILENGEKITMDEKAKDQLFGQARFLRALSFFHLVRLYGGVPIPESSTKSPENLEIARKTVDEVYDYLIKDLKYADDKLYKKSELPGTDRWMATKGAAEALLGKVYLYRGSMAEDSGKRNTYFTESKKYSGLVISSNEYSLEANVKDLWRWWNTNNKQGKESIFEIEFGYKGADNASRLHLDGGINITDQNLGSYMFYRFGPSFKTYDSFADNDKRKEATFLTSVLLSTGRTITWLEADKGSNPGTQGWTSATPGNLKYYDRTAESASTESPATDYYVLRYAEVLLNYAEAENELNGPTSDAYDKIRLVRERANIGPLTTGLNKQAFSDALYKERTWEFVGEGQLYYDALRTGRLGSLVKTEVDEGVAKGLWLYSPLLFKPKKTFLWKIPTFDLNSNSALVQNPNNISE